MRIKKLLAIHFFLLLNASFFYGQNFPQNKKFEVNGQILNKDIGRIVFWYFDDVNKFHSDTTELLNGKFQFNGSVNGVSEGILWTDIKNINFDDASVYRFLLEPGNIHIHITDSSFKTVGGKAQDEKEDWDAQKIDLINYKLNLRKSGKSSYEIQQVNEKIKTKDVAYIENHPDSYLSGYLLFNQKRKLSVDSLQMYFSMLSNKVKTSNLGRRILEELYPKTKDENFKKLNPKYDIEFEEKLNSIKSVYDFILKNNFNKETSLKSFKGKYLVLDFWASWCNPCIANFPTQKQLINIYKNDPIEFISISLDKDEVKWKQALQKYELHGVQLIAPKAFDELVAAYLKVMWVPHYVIIDQKGKIVYADAPQPLHPDFKILLDKLLEK